MFRCMLFYDFYSIILKLKVFLPLLGKINVLTLNLLYFFKDQWCKTNHKITVNKKIIFNQ